MPGMPGGRHAELHTRVTQPGHGPGAGDPCDAGPRHKHGCPEGGLVTRTVPAKSGPDTQAEAAGRLQAADLAEEQLWVDSRCGPRRREESGEYSRRPWAPGCAWVMGQGHCGPGSENPRRPSRGVGSGRVVDMGTGHLRPSRSRDPRCRSIRDPRATQDNTARTLWEGRRTRTPRDAP